MLTTERRSLIQKVLRETGRIVAKDFSQELGVSEDTIRRDLRELASEGLLQRVHGGALPASAATADFSDRERMGILAKVSLAKAAVKLISAGQIIFLDGGTTNVQLARHLPHEIALTVVTHSPSIAVELANHPLVQVEIIGGRLFKHSVVAMGATTLDAIENVRIDAYFMGVTGLHPDTGATTGDHEEAALKRRICRQSSETFIMATKEKLGAASAYRIVPLSAVSSVITETDIPDELAKGFETSQVNIIKP
ncbi:DeoR/GlpR transcriptional regulator [Rhizobium skierniewicense]|uniref:DeoR/GlpR family DNA-binding transcription regulator n=1 Tax=Rhizobium skierniewicense TaxID=984260 RepID=UPI001FAB57B0|nr:DeoR/GlpR family DNA-binding transcription regulator [Rhizobium skierniewicense]MCI9866916.1 DeoR/GlpR transcriptional regulator [Rhizobium skierniewicense]